MTDDRIALCELLEKSADADLLRSRKPTCTASDPLGRRAGQRRWIRGISKSQVRSSASRSTSGCAPSQLGCPGTHLFDPGSLRLSAAPSNPHPFVHLLNALICPASDIRTKMAVVRLLRRKWAERDEKPPEMGPQAGPHGSDNLPEMAAFCGLQPCDPDAEKECPDWADWRRERSCRRTLSFLFFNELE